MKWAMIIDILGSCLIWLGIICFVTGWVVALHDIDIFHWGDVVGYSPTASAPGPLPNNPSMPSNPFEKPLSSVAWILIIGGFVSLIAGTEIVYR